MCPHWIFSYGSHHIHCSCNLVDCWLFFALLLGCRMKAWHQWLSVHITSWVAKLTTSYIHPWSLHYSRTTTIYNQETRHIRHTPLRTMPNEYSEAKKSNSVKVHWRRHFLSRHSTLYTLHNNIVSHWTVQCMSSNFCFLGAQQGLHLFNRCHFR